MYSIQQDEDRDYQMGVASELQNALTISRLELEDDRADVALLRNMGRWVVVVRSTAYCRSTDAIIGERISLVGDFDNETDARAACSNDGDYECHDEVLPPLVHTVHEAPSEVPF